MELFWLALEQNPPLQEYPLGQQWILSLQHTASGSGQQAPAKHSVWPEAHSEEKR